MTGVKIGIVCSLVEETSAGSVATLVNWDNSKTAHPKGLRNVMPPSDMAKIVVDEFPLGETSVGDELHPVEGDPR